MDDGPSDEALREAAVNRGLRLVKSRRRKPGIGDYGLFGLNDAGGAPVFGFGEDGLTASARDIAAYLRRGEQSTWAESARITPANAGPKPRAVTEASPKQDRKPRSSSPASNGDKRPAGSAAGADIHLKAKADAANDAAKPASRPEKAPVRAARPKPELSIRPAGTGDADTVAALAAVLGGAADKEAVLRLIADSRRAREALLVAERGVVVGFLAWQTLRTLRHGMIGRITALVVEPGSRRSGIGGRLLDAVIDAMRARGCTAVEAISDIEVRNAHGFFRSANFEQTSIRFLRDCD